MSLAQNVTQLAPSCNDHELVVAVRRGNDRAFETLYGRYVARIRSYVHGMVGDHGRAEDVTQDVFIAALRRLRETDGTIAFKPWIYEIARNACIDEFRRHRRAQEVSLESPDATSEHLLSAAAAPDAAIETKQKLDDLRGAFHGLSETHHRITVMRELEGLSYAEIGERMGMSRPVVESTLFRARRRLHAEYDELVSGRRCEQVELMIAAGEQRPVRSLGIRQRQQLARHLAHCQPCRRTARMAGLDESFFRAPGLLGKIAALLPFPWLRLRQETRGADTVAASGSHRLSTLRPLQAVVQFADPTGPLTGFGRAATAAAAALAVAGAGGGIVASLGAHHSRPSGTTVPVRPVEAAGAPVIQHSAAAAQARARALPAAGGVGPARSSSAQSGAAQRPEGLSGISAAAAPAGSGPRSLAATGAGAGPPAAAAKLGGGVSSATGLLGGAGSGAPTLPKLPALGLPSPQSLTNAVNPVRAPSLPAPTLAVPRIQLPAIPGSDQIKLLPTRGRHAG